MAITVDILAESVRRLPDLADRAFARAAPEIELIAVGAMRRAMTDGVSPDGTPYKPLKYPRVRGGTKPLLDTGLLRASLSASMSERELTLRANAPGARVHQYGATIRAKPGGFLVFQVGTGVSSRGKGKRRAISIFAKSVTIPARPYVGLNQEAMDRIGYAVTLAAGAIIVEETAKGGG